MEAAPNMENKVRAETNNEVSQLNRWNQICQQWTTASQGKDCIVMGDMNIDLIDMFFMISNIRNSNTLKQYLIAL